MIASLLQEEAVMEEYPTVTERQLVRRWDSTPIATRSLKTSLGNFHRDGVTDAVEPTIVNDHDFASSSEHRHSPKPVKTGIYFGTILTEKIARVSPVEWRTLPILYAHCINIGQTATFRICCRVTYRAA